MVYQKDVNVSYYSWAYDQKISNYYYGVSVVSICNLMAIKIFNLNFSLLPLPAPEPATPMIPPVGLKAIVLSPNTIVVTWSDTSLGRNQRITDNRYYTIRYNQQGARRHRSLNSTDLNIHIDDLKPNTEYEFSVKVIKGRRESTWSMSVLNRTFEDGKQWNIHLQLESVYQTNLSHL